MNSSPNPLKQQKSALDSEERDNNFDGSHTIDRNDSLTATRQLSDSKARKRLYTLKPTVVDISDSQSDMATMPSV